MTMKNVFLVKENGYDSYEDAIDAEITREQAFHEIKKHGALWSEFLEMVGDKPMYTGKEVLDWLGY